MKAIKDFLKKYKLRLRFHCVMMMIFVSLLPISGISIFVLMLMTPNVETVNELYAAELLAVMLGSYLFYKYLMVFKRTFKKTTAKQPAIIEC